MRMDVRCISGHRPGDMFELPDEKAQPLVERGFLTSMELWEDRARAEKINDPWPEETDV